MEHNVPTVTIKQSDLDSPEKVEKFRTLFGKSNYFKALEGLSIERYGDGTLQRLQELSTSLDLNDKQDLKRYESLRSKMRMESNRLSSKENASVEVPIYDGTEEQVFKHKEMAKDYLGVSRYYKAAGFINDTEAATDRTLEKFNPHIKEQKKEKSDIKAQLDSLERKRKKLQEQEREQKQAEIQDAIDDQRIADIDA